jgi:hypothetical protein
MRVFEVGEKLYFVAQEFDMVCKAVKTPCRVTKKCDGYYLATEISTDHPQTFVIDEDTDYLFERA